MSKINLSFFVIVLSFFTTSFARAENTSIAGAAAANAEATKFIGTRITFPLQQKARYEDSTDTICIPGGTVLIGMESLSSNTLRARIKEHKIKDCDGRTELQYDRAIVIDNFSSEIIRNHPDVHGITSGILLVPYKAQLTGMKEISSATTLGAYVGWQDVKQSWGYALELVVFGGATSIPTTQLVNGQMVSQNTTGLSYGFGVIGSVKNSTRFGFVFGKDHVLSDTPYEYNDQWWFGAQIGYAFNE